MADRRSIRIANCSGFYGDRLEAAREMVEGGPIDVLTGDYLAELTMLILWKARQREARGGYAKTFLTQMEHVLGTCLDRGIKVVSNAGGLNPSGLAEDLGALATKLGLSPKIAFLDGDDLIGSLDELVAGGHDLANLDTGQRLADLGATPVSANAYLGAWGIAEGLAAGADIVICPRVTDASVVVGPAAWWHQWKRTDFDALAGAVAAGHVIECGPQATGGNYSWIEEITDRRYPGFPIAEVAADGSATITKHSDTGGLVSPGTVTAQLLYEIGDPAYLNPDVTAHFDTTKLEQIGEDRVLMSGTLGSAPPSTLKVAVNYSAGFRNTMTLVITGLDIDAKAAWATEQLFDILGGRDTFGEVDIRLLRYDSPDAPTNALATAHLQITVKDRDRDRAGRIFSNAVLQLFLGGFAGIHTTTPPTSASEYGVYWPTLVPREVVSQRLHLPDGSTVEIDHTAVTSEVAPAAVSVSGQVPEEPTTRAPLGLVCAARSGDKGGNANVGLWTGNAEGYAWLSAYLSVERFRELLPEAADLEIRRYELANLNALNFVIVGLLGSGVAASTRPDPQAKGLGEYLRSRFVDLPDRLLQH